MFWKLASLMLLMCAAANAAMPYTKDPIWQSTESNVYSTGLFWHDLDLDGDLDLFVSNGNDIVSATDYVYRNNGGTIATTHTWNTSVGDYSGHNAVGDIDADGYPEYFVANYIRAGWGAPRSMMYKNNAGTLNSSALWVTADTFHSFAAELGDPDGDGDLDIAFACGEGYNEVAEKLRIYFNNSGTMATSPGWQSRDATYMLDVAWADVELDGDLDLAFCSDAGRIWLFSNNGGELDTVPGWVSGDSSSSNTIAWGDLDNDGYLELAVADNDQLGGAGKFKIYKNNGGALSITPTWQSATGGYGSSVCWYDFDRDGDKDLAGGRWWGSIMIYENTGGGLTAMPVWQSNPTPVIEELRVCDLDKDGVEKYMTLKTGDGAKKVFYVENYPMHWLDSVKVDGIKLTLSQYCFDLNSGWVSLAAAPNDSAEFYYQYSDKQDIALSNWEGANMIFADTLTHVHPLLIGDANNNGIINVADVVYILQYIFTGGSAPDPIELGDVNCNIIVNISDVVYLIQYIFNSGPAPC